MTRLGRTYLVCAVLMLAVVIGCLSEGAVGYALYSTGVMLMFMALWILDVRGEDE